VVAIQQRFNVFDYIRSASTATKLITNFGRDITHVEVIEGTYNPATGGVTNTTTETTVKAVDFAVKGNEYINGTLVQAGDRYALLEPSIAAVDVSDKLIIDSVTWNIIAVEKLAPANVLVMWKVFIRK
jgi:ethanolamine utilization microcompartment shell protein EutS